MLGDKKEILIGFVVILVIAGGIFFWRRSRTNLKVPEATATPSVQNQIENKFNVQIPENVEKSELKDVSGGEGGAITTRKYENGVFSLTILANLPDLTGNEFYQGWLTKGKPGDSDYSLISLGKLRIAKGGFLLDYQVNKDYSAYSGVLITKELVNDNKPEKTILEGSF